MPSGLWALVDEALSHTLVFALWVMLAARSVLAVMLMMDWRRGRLASPQFRDGRAAV
jgi:hypothetical protein